MKAFDIILRIIIVVFMFPVDSTLPPPPHFLISTSNSWTHAPPTPRHGIITLLGTITRFPFMWPSSRVRLNRRYVRHCRDICLVIKSGGDKYALKPRYPRGNFARNTSPRSLKPTNLPSELHFFVFLAFTTRYECNIQGVCVRRNSRGEMISRAKLNVKRSIKYACALKESCRACFFALVNLTCM